MVKKYVAKFSQPLFTSLLELATISEWVGRPANFYKYVANIKLTTMQQTTFIDK